MVRPSFLGNSNSGAVIAGTTAGFISPACSEIEQGRSRRLVGNTLRIWIGSKKLDRDLLKLCNIPYVFI